MIPGASRCALSSTQPGDPFLIEPETGQVRTFGQLKQRSIAVSRRLAGLGLGRGARVTFLLDNGLFTAVTVQVE